MPTLSKISQQRLETCHPDLIKVFTAVAATWPLQIIEGHRTKALQDAAFKAKKSQLPWPKSYHNSTPSNAVDAAPLPIDWADRERFSFFAGWVLATANGMGVELVWGGDWDGDLSLKNNSFDDLVHFEMKVR